MQENGYELLFLSARAISQSSQTRQFLFNLKQVGYVLISCYIVHLYFDKSNFKKHIILFISLFPYLQDGKALPDGPVVISPDGLFPSLFREGKWCLCTCFPRT